MRPVVRGVCCWYQSLHVAKAAASCRYRIGHFVEMFAGVDVIISGAFPARLAAQCRTLSCLRPLATPKLLQALDRLRSLGVVMVADFDDLLFAGEVTGLPPSAGAGLPDAEKRRRLAAYTASLEAFQRFTVSTRALAAQLQPLVPRSSVTVVPNGLSESWLARGRALYRSFRPGDPLVIRYFAGSPSHDRDFDSIIAPLAAFLNEHRQVRLEVVGPVNFDASKFPAGSVAALPSVSYQDLPRLLASTWVSLAPLETNSFNVCKSALKVLESGAFECPTLTSPSDDTLRHAGLGAPLLFCRTADDWYQNLVALLEVDRRMALGRAIAEHVGVHGMARAASAAWLAGLGTETSA